MVNVPRFRGDPRCAEFTQIFYQIWGYGVRLWVNVAHMGHMRQTMQP